MQKNLFIILLLIVGSICQCSANTILLAPTGTTLTTGQVRAEAAFGSDSVNNNYYWLATGFQQYEASVIRIDNQSGDSENIIGAQWNFLPETILTPAVSFGVRDIASQSAEGAGIYAAITRHLPLGETSIIKDFAATVGVGALGIRGPFVGFETKLPMHLFVEGEYDSHDFNAAIGFQPNKYFRVKAYTLRSESYLGAELVPIAF